LSNTFFIFQEIDSAPFPFLSAGPQIGGLVLHAFAQGPPKLDTKIGRILFVSMQQADGRQL
jgi:hypothetical protein